MYVLIVSAVFPPEPIVSAQTSAQIAEELASRGHEVSVVTAFPSKPGGSIYPGYRRTLYERQRVGEHLGVVRCFSFPSAESSVASRFLENLSFGLTSGGVVLASRRPDVIYANTWPIIAAGLLSLVARVRRVPLVISVQDLYPESLVAQGRLGPSHILTRWMRWIDSIIARGSQAVIVISERFAEIYRQDRKVSGDRVHAVPNWVDGRSIAVEEWSAEWRLEQGIPRDSLLLAYGGNIGMAAGVETVIEAFRHLRGEERVHLLIAGEGANLAKCQALASDVASGTISFCTPWPVEETSRILRSADVLLLPTRSDQSLVSVPSKLAYYMLAARPVLALALSDSDTAQLVETSGCGWVVEPDRPELLACQIQRMVAMAPSELIRRGTLGREFALRNLTREACLPAILDVLESVSLSQSPA